MLEFLFGWIVGVWMGQQLPLPSVHEKIQTWWDKPQITNQADENKTEETLPIFTGEMPSPSV